VIVETSKGKLAIVIDDVEEVVVPSANDIIQSSSFDPVLDNMGFLRQEEGIIFIYDPETLFSGREEVLLRELIEDSARKPS
jgi:chemotaxis signal transduction protein